MRASLQPRGELSFQPGAARSQGATSLGPGPWACPGRECKCVTHEGWRGRWSPGAGGAWEDPRAAQAVPTECSTELGLSAFLCSPQRGSPQGHMASPTQCPGRLGTGGGGVVQGLVTFDSGLCLQAWPVRPARTPRSAHTSHSSPVLRTPGPSPMRTTGCQGRGQRCSASGPCWDLALARANSGLRGAEGSLQRPDLGKAGVSHGATPEPPGSRRVLTVSASGIARLTTPCAVLGAVTVCARGPLGVRVRGGRRWTLTLE